ncbi:hypothetical protein C8R44DRAFT_733922 [Mycena epipterygia]|nr:hypothetical protein C8R44DRAFT_733922 [Mycena epipterygia]
MLVHERELRRINAALLLYTQLHEYCMEICVKNDSGSPEVPDALRGGSCRQYFPNEKYDTYLTSVRPADVASYGVLVQEINPLRGLLRKVGGHSLGGSYTRAFCEYDSFCILIKERVIRGWTEWRQGRAGSGAEPWDRRHPPEITKEALIIE